MANVKQENKLNIWVVPLIVLSIFFILVWILRSILWPFLFSMGLAYVINPLVIKLQNKINKRELSIIIAILLCFFIVIVFFVTIIPILIQQIISIFEIFPHILSLFNKYIISWLNTTFGTNLNVVNLKTMTSLILNHKDEVQVTLSKGFSVIVEKSGGAINLLVGLVLIPFLLYYFLLDWPRWKDIFYKLIPRRFYNTCIKIMRDIDRSLGEFIKGQLTVMFLMSLIFGFSLTFVGLKNGFLIGFISGALVFIPYLGTITGFFLAITTAILQFNNFYNILLVVVVFLIGHFLESFIITPKLVGNRIGLSPLLVIFALFAFGKLMGIAGILLSLPLASVCSVLFKEGLKFYFSSNFYLKK